MLFLGIVALLIVGFFVAVFIHELGHVIAGSLAGFRVLAFGQGVPTATGVMTLPIGGIRYYLTRTNPFCGLTLFQIDQLFPPPGRLILVFAGGGLANLITAIVAFAIFFQRMETWVGFAACIFGGQNLALVQTTLFPAWGKMGTAVMRNDGATLIELLRHGGIDQNMEAQIAGQESFCPFLQAIGLPVLERTYLLSGAVAWATLGRPEEALALFEKQATITLDSKSSPGVVGLEAFAGMLISEASGNPEQFERWRSKAHEHYRSTGEGAAVDLLDYVDAERNARLNPNPETINLLDDFSARPQFTRMPSRRRSLLLSRLIVRKTLGDTAAAEDLETRLNAELDPTNDLATRYHLDRTLARLAASRGDEEEAARRYRSLLRSIGRCCAIPITEEGRARARASYQPQIDEAARWVPDAEQALTEGPIPQDVNSTETKSPAVSPMIRAGIRLNVALIAAGGIWALSGQWIDNVVLQQARYGEGIFLTLLPGLGLLAFGIMRGLESLLQVPSRRKDLVLWCCATLGVGMWLLVLLS